MKSDHFLASVIYESELGAQSEVSNVTEIIVLCLSGEQDGVWPPAV